MFRSRPVSLALVGLFVWLTGCSSYSQIELNEVADHGRVRVTLTDGERETIHEPRVDADSVRGREATFALDRVAKLEAVGTDEVGTVFTILGLAVLLTPVVYCAVADPEMIFEPNC